MQNNTPYQVCLIANEAYFAYATTLMKNFVAFHRHPVRFVILHNVEETNKAAFESVTKEFIDYKQVEINFHYIDGQDLVHLGMMPSNSRKPTNFRLLIPQLGYTGRMLYLDVDIMVTQPINELFTDPNILQGNAVGGVVDIITFKEKYSDYNYFSQEKYPEDFYAAQFGKNGNYYINAGVLLLDLDKLKEPQENGLNIWQNGIKKYFTGELPWLDQTFVNLVHAKAITYLPVKYNYFLNVLYEQRYYSHADGWHKSKNLKVGKQNGLLKAPYYPSIVHCLSQDHRKQWNYPDKEIKELFTYWKNTPLSTLVSRDVQYYTNMMHNFWHQYNFATSLLDYVDMPNNYEKVELEQVTKALETQKPWTYNPLFINPYMYPPQGKRAEIVLQNFVHPRKKWRYSRLNYYFHHKKLDKLANKK
ncbi:glycosyltransferase [Psittacicella hinzii]|uniref:Glycosyltransferase family 8 protein n=1 Tax=Psittacicella hinzii TaxID=2028575 RepID=A0A3A1YNE5_9GAMM|nr:glycosyltransferase [Psittacicella hinzii]RIY38996.1 hypothetical protein CKF58_03020 [Psittacicella hinzii]